MAWDDDHTPDPCTVTRRAQRKRARTRLAELQRKLAASERQQEGRTMSLWVTTTENWEESDLVGVFDSVEKAEAAARKHAARNTPRKADLKFDRVDSTWGDRGNDVRLYREHGCNYVLTPVELNEVMP